MRAFVLDEAAVRKVDRSGAAEHLKSLSDQVARGLQLGSALGPLAAHRRVVVVGVGGSGIAGAVLAAWLAGGGPGAREGGLVVGVSYSGNTVETLTAMREAMARGSELVGISSGGTLRDLCHGRGLPFVSMPPGFMPRSAFGYIFGGLAGG